MRNQIVKYCLTVAAAIYLVGCGPVETVNDFEYTVKDTDEAMSDTLVPIQRVDTVNFICPDTVILGRIKQVYVVDKSLVVVDNMTNVYGFAADGTYQCQYGRAGHAPSEYVNMAACCVTPRGDEVVIVDSYAQRMIYYDLHNGEFKRYVNFPVGTLDMVQQCVFVSDSTALLARYVYNKQNAVYAIANMVEPSVEDFASVELTTENVAIPVGRHAISVYEGKGAYIKPFEPALYKYRDVNWIFIDQPKKVYNKEQLAEIIDFSMSTYANAMTDNYFAGYTDLYELKDWIFLGCADNEFSLINKANAKLMKYKSETDDMMNYKNIARIIGSIPESNTLIGFNDGPMSEDERIFLYKLYK